MQSPLQNSIVQMIDTHTKILYNCEKMMNGTESAQILFIISFC